MSFDELPDLLTVEEAGRFLRISRGLAYQLAKRNVESGGIEGLPVIRLGRRMLVPKRQLERLLSGEITLESKLTETISRPRRPARRTQTGAPPMQLALLPSQDPA